jgi:PPK2 family polyphosphate:nucleotide phosphotransferase
MIDAIESPYRVPYDGAFEIGTSPTAPVADGPGKKECKRRLKDRRKVLRDYQRRLFAADSSSLLLVFQALDAAGKDGTIRAVFSGVNPAGCQVYSFKQPSAEELGHDFLWRTTCRLPERGRLGVFNRSYYEEVLVVKVHPEHLAAQRLPPGPVDEAFWSARYQSIREHEEHLARNGTIVVKFWLNVGREEQRRRLLRRIDDPDRNWKFNKNDVIPRQGWNDYMSAYQDALNQTSRPWAPWYAIPADNKAFMRLTVADIVARTLQRLDPRYPELGEDERGALEQMRNVLEGQD